MKKTLIYLNCVLTVIAIALTALVLQNAEIIPKAYAANNLYGLPLNEKGEVPVKIMNSDMDVQVTNTVDVNVDEVGGYSCYSKVPVVIKQNDDK